MQDLHPMIVHFPIALLTAGVMLDLFDLVTRGERFRLAALVLITVGALGALVAMLTGDAAADVAENIVGIERALEQHEELGELTAWIFLGYAALRLALHLFWRTQRLPLAVLRWAGVAALGLLLYTGHLGGGLVHNYGAGTVKAATVHMVGGEDHD